MLSQLSPQLSETLVRIVLALLAFVTIWVLRHLMTQFVRAVLARVAGRFHTSLDVTLPELLTGPVKLLVFALAVSVSTRILEPDPSIDVFVFRLTRTLVIVAIALVIYRLVSIVAQSRSRLYAFTGISIEEALLPFARAAVHLILIALEIVIIIQIWGYDVTGLVAGLGLGGLAFSLAAQDTVSNLFGFSMIISDRPFVVGEYIKTPDVEGTVERVGFRSTSVRKPDQSLATIPNSTLASSAILNWSRLSRRWIDQTLLLGYGVKPEQLTEVMDEIRAMLKARPDIDPDTVVVHFINFGSSALEILVRAYVKHPNWLDFTREKEAVNLEIMRILGAHRLTFAAQNRMLLLERLPNVGEDSAARMRMTDVKPDESTGVKP